MVLYLRVMWIACYKKLIDLTILTYLYDNTRGVLLLFVERPSEVGFGWVRSVLDDAAALSLLKLSFTWTALQS